MNFPCLSKYTYNFACVKEFRYVHKKENHFPQKVIPMSSCSVCFNYMSWMVRSTSTKLYSQVEVSSTYDRLRPKRQFSSPIYHIQIIKIYNKRQRTRNTAVGAALLFYSVNLAGILCIDVAYKRNLFWILCMTSTFHPKLHQIHSTNTKNIKIIHETGSPKTLSCLIKMTFEHSHYLMLIVTNT